MPGRTDVVRGPYRTLARDPAVARTGEAHGLHRARRGQPPPDASAVNALEDDAATREREAAALVDELHADEMRRDEAPPVRTVGRTQEERPTRDRPSVSPVERVDSDHGSARLHAEAPAVRRAQQAATTSRPAVLRVDERNRVDDWRRDRRHENSATRSGSGSRHMISASSRLSV